MFDLLRSALTPRTVTNTYFYKSEDLYIPPKDYLSHKRTVSTYSQDMNHNVQESPSPNGSFVSRTGFPEPLSHERNTTLPHPDADTSPNATIEAPDLERTHSYRSFFHHKNHSHGATKHGKCEPDDLSGHYDNIEYADGSHKIEKDEKDESPSSQNGAVVDEKERRESEAKKKGFFKKLLHD